MKVFILFKSKEIIGTETTNLWYEVESYGITRNKQKKKIIMMYQLIHYP